MNRVTNSSAFCNLLWKRKQSDNTKGCKYFMTAAVPPKLTVVLVGQGEELGSWSVEKGVKLLCDSLPKWWLPDDLEIENGREYKFVLVDNSGDNEVFWEDGENRVWSGEVEALGEFRGLPDFAPKVAGVVVPVFSLRGTKSEGIGDFISLGEFAQWAGSVGMKVVQTLPINDTTSTHSIKDSYPYSAISSFALHPLYIRIGEMDSSINTKELRRLEKNKVVDYTQVDKLKWQAFRESYKKNGERVLASPDFKNFYLQNNFWLAPYAAFCWLRERYQSVDFSQWPAPYNTFSGEVLHTILHQQSVGVGLHLYLQYFAHNQLLKAKDMAYNSGVCFKGDIPIGVDRHSVDVWCSPELFNLDKSAGAPPDDFSTQGQNWGFPTYNWKEMAKDDFGWWVARLKKMGDYFDMYRIDHVLGFFRIWEISFIKGVNSLMGLFSPSLPMSISELEGRGFSLDLLRHMGVDENDFDTLFIADSENPNMYHPRIAAQFTMRYKTLLQSEKDAFNEIYNHYFYHRHNDFWAGKALGKLPVLLNATKMIPCAEDLGMVPDCVGWVLSELGVITLEIDRMPKNPYSVVGDSANNPYLCVASTGTHDMQTLREWWEDDRQRVSIYYNEVLGLDGAAPEVLSGEVARMVIERMMNSGSFAVILPLSDFLAMDEGLRVENPKTERINDPSNPNNYWQYRVNLSIGELFAAKKYNKELRGLLKIFVNNY